MTSPAGNESSEGLEPAILPLRLGHVGDHADDEGPLFGLQRAQAQLDGDLAAVLAEGPELAARTGSDAGLARKLSRRAG